MFVYSLKAKENLQVFERLAHMVYSIQQVNFKVGRGVGDEFLFQVPPFLPPPSSHEINHVSSVYNFYVTY